jgi:hypothetical protein
MPRRQHITLFTLIGAAAVLAIFFVSIFRNQAEGTRHPDYLASHQDLDLNLDEGILRGEATAPKLENATLKYVYNFVKAVNHNANLSAEQSLAMQHGKSFIQ